MQTELYVGAWDVGRCLKSQLQHHRMISGFKITEASFQSVGKKQHCSLHCSGFKGNGETTVAETRFTPHFVIVFLLYLCFGNKNLLVFYQHLAKDPIAK